MFPPDCQLRVDDSSPRVVRARPRTPSPGHHGARTTGEPNPSRRQDQERGHDWPYE